MASDIRVTEVFSGGCGQERCRLHKKVARIVTNAIYGKAEGGGWVGVRSSGLVRNVSSHSPKCALGKATRA